MKNDKIEENAVADQKLNFDMVNDSSISSDKSIPEEIDHDASYQVLTQKSQLTVTND